MGENIIKVQNLRLSFIRKVEQNRCNYEHHGSVEYLVNYNAPKLHQRLVDRADRWNPPLYHHAVKVRHHRTDNHNKKRNQKV